MGSANVGMRTGGSGRIIFTATKRSRMRNGRALRFLGFNLLSMEKGSRRRSGLPCAVFVFEGKAC